MDWSVAFVATLNAACVLLFLMPLLGILCYRWGYRAGLLDGFKKGSGYDLAPKWDQEDSGPERDRLTAPERWWDIS